MVNVDFLQEQPKYEEASIYKPFIEEHQTFCLILLFFKFIIKQALYDELVMSYVHLCCFNYSLKWNPMIQSCFVWLTEWMTYWLTDWINDVLRPRRIRLEFLECVATLEKLLSFSVMWIFHGSMIRFNVNNMKYQRFVAYHNCTLY